MCGGSEPQAAQRNAATAAAPTAAAAAPGAVLELQEPVWRLLLGELWQPPEQQVVCTLLCCSRAMARLVHAVCAGRLHVRLGEQPRQWSDVWDQQVTAYGEAYCRWLAKHARLLAELRVEAVETSQLHYVAAGLCAAAGMGAAAQRVTRAQAASQSEAMRAAAAAAAAGPAPASAQQQGLTLCSLLSTGYSDSNGLLHGLAACRQLTQLQLDWWGPERLQDLAAGLASLRGLKDLSLGVKYSAASTVAVPALQLGTQLTKLRLVNLSVSAEAMRSLPPSLADLEYHPPQQGAPVYITHLSRLVRLSWQFLQAGDKLPPSLERVDLRDPASLEPLHPLTRLQALQLCFLWSCNLEQLQAAVAAIGPSLTALDVDVGKELGGQLLSQRIAGPRVLPLTRLTVSSWYGGSVAHLGQWTGLERLQLMLTGSCDVQQLAGQLTQLTALQELKLRTSCHSPPLLQPLVDAIVGMASLRSFHCSGSLSDQQRAQLQAATHLRELRIQP